VEKYDFKEFITTTTKALRNIFQTKENLLERKKYI
jgi:hypothetical protein